MKEETGFDVEITSNIGERLHPKTDRAIVYFHCTYIGGDLDTKEVNNDDIERLI